MDERISMCSIGSSPAFRAELRRIADRDEREELQFAVERRVEVTPAFQCTYALLAILGAGSIAAWRLASDALHLSGFAKVASFVGWMAVWVVLFNAGLRRLFLRRGLRYLRAALCARGIPTCLRCGYDLRGQTTARCPECGRPFAAALLRPGGASADAKVERPQ